MNWNYKDLLVWKKSIQLTIDVYEITNKFPNKENFNLVSQINRAVVSIPSNIAEWNWRNNSKEVNQFLYISKWSCNEVDTQLYISKELWYIDDKNYNKIKLEIEEILKMLSWLIKSNNNR